MVDDMMFSCLQSQREKKDAEQCAAFEALKALGYISPSDMYSPKLGKNKGITFLIGKDRLLG